MIINFIRGFCMALADSVPGVSGGTIAFLLGFYDKFISSLNDLMRGNKEERKRGLKFLLKLGLGWIIGMALATSILAVVFDKGIYKVSSLFIGFVLAALPIMIIEEKDCLKGKYHNLVFVLLGIAIVVLLSILKIGSNLDVTNLSFGLIIYIIIAGMIAISAMVLPGISGSTILLTFGLYIPVITAVKNVFHFNFSGILLLIIFALGVILGVFITIRGIKKLLEKRRSATIYAVLGMMIGSIYAIINGPTTLNIPKEAMSFDTFSIIFFLIGVAIIFILQKIKNSSWYKKEEKNT